jgi:hypothetical protein
LHTKHALVVFDRVVLLNANSYGTTPNFLKLFKTLYYGDLVQNQLKVLSYRYFDVQSTARQTIQYCQISLVDFQPYSLCIVHRFDWDYLTISTKLPCCCPYLQLCAHQCGENFYRRSKSFVVKAGKYGPVDSFLLVLCEKA